ncbi:MAG: HEAT repeat domain-containing protein [Desulfobacterales bacterium]|nr:HEAT repeat domain-containing protein [Desulfobacterales bacterium]
MSSINAKEFIDELVFCLKEEDVVKAKALLQFASDSNVDVDVQKKALLELAKGPEKVVFPLLEFLTKIDIADQGVQEGLYDLILDKAYGNTDLVIEYIANNEKPTQIQFIKAAGDLFLEETIPALTNVIQNESDPEIVAPAVDSLSAFRKPETISVFAPLAGHTDMGVRRSAIFAIGANGTTDAVDMLLQFLGEDEKTNKLAVESLSEMQDIYALEKMTGLLASPITIVRDTAIDQLMKMGTKATPLLTRAFKNAEADYLVHLVTTLGYLKDPAAISAIMDIINTQPKDANIRQAAYEAMERIPSPKTAICLAQGLQDPVESVRMSAARAIDKNLSKPLVAGLKNIVREDSEAAMTTVAALIDTEATNIFNFLVEEDSFKALAKKHVVENASPATRKAFIKNMSGIGQKDLVQEITDSEPAKEESQEDSKAKIIVVDDSKMMLRLYQNKLSALGFEPEVFHRPEDAIPKILAGDIDLVITDLNMPNISGLELSREVRKKFTRQDLPILMITTQSDFVEQKDGDIDVNDSMLKKSGINKVLHKPFTDEDFKDSVFKFLTP